MYFWSIWSKLDNCGIVWSKRESATPRLFQYSPTLALVGKTRASFSGTIYIGEPVDTLQEMFQWRGSNHPLRDTYFLSQASIRLCEDFPKLKNVLFVSNYLFTIDPGWTTAKNLGLLYLLCAERGDFTLWTRVCEQCENLEALDPLGTHTITSNVWGKVHTKDICNHYITSDFIEVIESVGYELYEKKKNTKWDVIDERIPFIPKEGAHSLGEYLLEFPSIIATQWDFFAHFSWYLITPEIRHQLTLPLRNKVHIAPDGTVSNAAVLINQEVSKYLTIIESFWKLPLYPHAEWVKKMAHLLIHGSDEERENVSISENYRDVRVQWNPREIQAHLIEDIRTHVYLPFSEYQKTLASIIRWRSWKSGYLFYPSNVYLQMILSQVPPTFLKGLPSHKKKDYQRLVSYLEKSTGISKKEILDFLLRSKIG